MGVDNGLRRRIAFHIYVIVFVFTSAFVIAEKKSVLIIPFSYDQAQTQCPENEMFKMFLVDCTNCEQRGRCAPEIGRQGCDCVQHFVRLTPGGKCEPVSKCPIPTCGENEVYRACGPNSDSCVSMRHRVLSCDYKCYCKEGFWRDSHGKCIPQDECPKKTECFPATEERAESGLSDEYCLYSETENVSNVTVNKTGCYCKQGFKRNLLGYCMMEEFCSISKCRGHEEYKKCLTKCNTTCNNLGDPSCKEDGNCYQGCFCEDGYVMNDHRTCVRIEDCPPRSNPLVTTADPTTPELVTETPSTNKEDNNTTNATTPGIESTTRMDESVSTTEEDHSTSGATEKDKTVTDESDYRTVIDGTTELALTTPNSKPTNKPGKTRNVRSANPRPSPEEQIPEKKNLTMPVLPS